MRTTAQRKASYATRMLSSLIDPTIAAKAQLAVDNFGAYVDEFVAKQMDLRVILNDYDLDPIMFAGYEAFHGEMYHLWKVCAGLALTTAATTLRSKWQQPDKIGPAGSDVMKRIQLEIYNVTT